MNAGLLPQHVELLKASAISDEVAAARGYRSVESKAELISLGFNRTQARPPALLLPVWGVTGEVVNYQVRPDQPRIRNGKLVKYETPAGSRMDLDVPPSCRHLLADPRTPLFVTEAIRKADSAASKDLCCVGLLGVWNWRGTNELGGKVALPAFESIALNGREVYIAFDSDVMTKAGVREALRRLRDFLAKRDAHVEIILLPAGKGGTKTGLDDYLASGHDVNDLLALAVDDLPMAGVDEQPHLDYRAGPEGLFHVRHSGETIIEVPLTNFTAEIVADLSEDDGAESHRIFEITAKVRDRTRTFRVAAQSFPSMAWASEHLGAGAIVYAGLGVKDHARVAIQTLSGTIPDRTIFTHTGWREVDGQAVYLHAGGAVGTVGTVGGIEVRLESPLDRFHLPDPPEGDELRQAVRASLQVLEVAPDRITVPLIGAAYRAPLGAADLSVHLSGPTGAGKTELAALAQAHFGARFDARELPGSWSSTPNANEDLAFRAKDVLFVVDDFAPGGSRLEVSRVHRDADRLLRAQGNRSGRQRMRSDGSLRPARPPRGLTLSTGEDVPRGASLGARMVVDEVGPNDLDWDQLTRCQADAKNGLYAASMAGYVRWLAGKSSSDRQRLRQSVSSAGLTSFAGHRRIPRNLDALAAGFCAFLTFALEVGAINAADYQGLLGRGVAAIQANAAGQTAIQYTEDPARRFVDLVGSAITSGKAHVAGPNGGLPTKPEVWGWRAEAATTYGPARDALRPQGPLIGWLSDEALYLDPDPSFAAAQAMAMSVGEPIGISPKTMYRRLKDAGFLLTAEAERERLTVRRTLQGTRRAVLHIRSDLFEEPSQPSQPAQPADEADQGDDNDRRPESHESASGKVVPHQPAQTGPVPDDEVLETVRAALASGLLGSRPVRLDDGVQATDPALAAARWLGEAERPGWVGDVARVHLARLCKALRDGYADA